MKRGNMLVAVALALGSGTAGLTVTQQIAVAAPPDYEGTARTIIADMVARQFDKVVARFDDRMHEAVTADKLAPIWDGLIAEMGALVSITKVESSEQSSYHIIYATCAFEKNSWTLVLAFTPEGELGGFSSTRDPWKAPEYAKPDTFEEQSITVQSGHWDLPGTLTLPKGQGPFAAVVLVHGSGPNDQDETIGPNKIFKDLAWGLASQGIAVLRYTKRTKQYGAKSFDDPNNFTVKDETIDDARAAVSLAAVTSKIDPKRIYIAGHSQGAYLGPRIAYGAPQIAGLILMAGNTRPLEDLVVEQVRYVASLNGAVTPEGQKGIDKAEESAREFRNLDLKPGMTVDLLGAKLPATYVLDLRSYHPRDVAATLTIPIFVLQGGRDYQVRAADFDGWKKALAAKPNVMLKLYPDLNHLFAPGSGPSSPGEYMKQNHVPVEVVADIAAWIAAVGK
jgi:uncharacterized protein